MCCLVNSFMQLYLPLFHRTLLCGVNSLKKVLVWTDTPIPTVDLCSCCLCVVFVVSLIIALLAQSVRFGWAGWGLSFVKFLLVSCSFHFVIMDLMVHCGMVEVWDIIHNLILVYISPQLCLWCVWRAPWSPCCLFSGFADSWAFPEHEIIPRSCDILIAYRWSNYLCECWS